MDNMSVCYTLSKNLSNLAGYLRMIDEIDGLERERESLIRKQAREKTTMNGQIDKHIDSSFI